MTGADSIDPVLRAKYLDWCSARIAERFLAMTPDEIYELAEQTTHGAADLVPPPATLSPSISDHTSDAPDWHAAIGQAAATLADPVSGDAASFHAIVARVTEVLADEMILPTLEEWSAAYSEAPEEFDAEMLGFWKEQA